jgi:hypothetical protein
MVFIKNVNSQITDISVLKKLFCMTLRAEPRMLRMYSKLQGLRFFKKKEIPTVISINFDTLLHGISKTENVCWLHAGQCHRKQRIFLYAFSKTDIYKILITCAL